jgi:hypothetical protein
VNQGSSKPLPGTGSAGFSIAGLEIAAFATAISLDDAGSPVRMNTPDAEMGEQLARPVFLIPRAPHELAAAEGPFP